MGTQGFDKGVVFLSGKRTPFGTFGGSLKDFTATDLAVCSANGALEAGSVGPNRVDHVVYATPSRPPPTRYTWPVMSGCGWVCPRKSEPSR